MTSSDRFPMIKDGIYRLSDDERAAVRRGLQEMREGIIASDEEVAAVFDRVRAQNSLKRS